MAQLVIGTADPASGDSDVFVNIALDVTFTTAVLSTSVSNTSVLLTNSGTASVVSANVELIGTTQIRITPYGNLAEDTVYKVSFPGTDTALSSDYVIKDAALSEALTTTLTVTFTTGSRVFLDQTNIDKDATDLSLEGDLSLPVHVKALGNFAISSTSPKNHSYDVAGSTGLLLTFNQDLSTGDFAQNWLDVDVFPVMDDTVWLASGDAYSGSIPSHTISLTGAIINVDFNGDLPQNAGINVTVSSNVISTDGSEFGPNDYLLSYTTDRFPKVSGVHVIKREIKAASDELTDDYIASILLSKTIEADIKFGVDSAPHISLVKWVVNSVIVDILDDVELSRAIVAGTRRQLGDMNISVDPIIGKLAIKHARAEKKIEDSEKTMLGKKLVASAYNNSYRSGLSRPSRLWFGVSNKIIDSRFISYQSDRPAANTSTNRGAKIRPDSNWGGVV
jgi:hypothetical protein